MSHRRSSSRTLQLAQRRPRTDKACNFCRIAKQRCEPTEYGTNDRPCRRCVSQGLDCNLSRVVRSQSPSSGPSAQGPGPIRHHIVPRSASGSAEELTLAPETNVQYGLQQRPGSAQAPTRWPPLMMHSDSEERRSPSTTILAPGQPLLGTPSFPGPPLAPAMEGYQQSFLNVAQGGGTHPESSFSLQDYYRHTIPCNTYMTDYATQNTSDGERNLGYVVEEQARPGNDDSSAGEQDASLFSSA